MSPLVWDLAHVGNYEELWLLRAAAGGRADAARDRRPLRRLRASARRAADAAAAAPRRGPRLHRRGARQGARRRSTAIRLDGRRPAAATTASSTAWSSSTSTSTTRRCSPPTSCAAARACSPTSRPAPPPADAATCPPRCSCPAGPFTMGTSDRPVGLRQRAAGRTRSTCRRSGSTPPRSPTGAYLAFVEAGGYDDPRWWTGAGLGVAQRRRATAPRVLAAARAAQWLRRRFGRVEPLPAGPAGAARVLARGRRLRAVGRPAAADRGRVGEGRVLGPGRRAQAPLPVGRRRPDRRARQPRPAPPSARPRWAPTRPAPAPAACRQMIGDVWEWTVERLRAPTPASGRSRTAEYSEVFFGGDYKVLRGGSWATDPTAVPVHVPQLGLPDPPADLRRLPHARDARPARASTCAATSPTSARPASLASLALRPAALAARGSPDAPREQRHGPVNADGFGVGWYAPTSAPSRPATARAPPIWTDRSFAVAAPASCHAARCWRPSARATAPFPIDEAGDGAVHRRAVAVQPQRLRRRLPRRRRRAAARLPAAAAAGIEGTDATPRCCGRSSLDAARATAPRRRRAARGRRRRAAPHERAGSTCCSPTATSRGDRVRRHALFTRRRGPAAVHRRVRAARRRARLGAGARPLLVVATADQPRRAPRCPPARATTGDRMTTASRPLRIDRHRHRRRRLPRHCAPTCARAHRDAQVAAAEVVLRRRGQRAVRGDHPAAGVLPDPRASARSSRAHAGDIAAAHAAPPPWSSSAPASSEKTRLLLDALADAGTLRALSCRSTSATSALIAPRHASAADYPGLEVHGVVADFERAPRAAAHRRAPRWSPSSAARSATSSPAPRAEFLAESPTSWRPATRSCSAPTW